MCIEQKVEQYREKLIRIIELKKKLIDSEISLQKVMIDLRNHYKMDYKFDFE